MALAPGFANFFCLALLSSALPGAAHAADAARPQGVEIINTTAEPVVFAMSARGLFFNNMQLDAGESAVIYNAGFLSLVSGDIDDPPLTTRLIAVEKGAAYEIYLDPSCNCRNARLRP